MLDAYTRRTRVATAALATSPVLALGLVLLPSLPGAQKLWSVLALGVTSYAANVARRRGNRVQQPLWDEWGGAPTTSRLRFRDSETLSEILRRHADVEAAVPGVRLPTQEEEQADAAAADREYRAAVGRAINPSVTTRSSRFFMRRIATTDSRETFGDLSLSVSGVPWSC